MEDREIEIKLKIKDSTKLLNWLGTNAKLIDTADQSDYYFDPPHKSYLYIDRRGRKTAKEYIRVRIENNKGYFCYKFIDKDLALTEHVPIEEIETAVNNPGKIIKILIKAGFINFMTIKKRRTSYRFHQFQIDLDRVEELGDFMEIEYKGSAKNYKTGYLKINSLVKKIGIRDWEEAKGGYVELMLNRK